MKSQSYHFDAQTMPLGRLATKVAELLLGKNLVDFKPNQVVDVLVVITNTDQTVLTGNKEADKRYYRYSGYPGGMRSRNVAEQRSRDSRVIVSQAVFGMLPKNSLRAVRMKNLKLYKDASHPHGGQLNHKPTKE